MKKEECLLKTRVALVTSGYNRYSNPYAKYGYIAGLTSVHPVAGDVVIVEWDSGAIDKVAIKALLLETEAKAELARQEAEKIKLELEFEKVRLLVETKIQEASTAVLDATKIAKDAQLNLHDDFADEISPLESAMGRAGWSTSSWHC